MKKTVGSIRNPLDRRGFLQKAGIAVAGSVIADSIGVLAEQTPGTPRNLRFGAPPDPGPAVSGKALLRSSDLQYRGMWRLPDTDTGTYSFAEGPLAFRYVNGQRRWLTIPKKGPYNIVELGEPSTLGDSPDTAPDMPEIRGWSGVFNITATDANGFVIGGLWWDQQQGVLWYTVYPFYSPNVYPFLGATRLNDNGSVTKYGMWSYGGDGSSYKQVCQWIVPIPSSAQAAAGGRSVAIGAGVVSIGAACNFGPGLLAMTLPSLSSSGLVPEGRALMAYNSEVNPDQPDFYCKREPDYSVIKASDTIFNPKGSTGFWAASLDAVSGYAWIETASKQGVLCLGRRGSGRMWYGSPDAYGDGKLVDGAQYGNGFHAEFYTPSVWVFDPEELKAAGRGAIKPWKVAYKERANWKTLWPGIPTRPEGIHTPGGQPATAAYDSSKQQLFWMLPLTYNPGFNRNPTVQVWNVPS
jgi:hypothetical protein